MRGYPEHINTKQDFENLLDLSEYKAQTLTELKHVRDLNDSKLVKATTQKDPEDPESDWNTIEITNSNPKWKQLAFKSKKELTDLITTAEEMLDDK